MSLRRALQAFDADAFVKRHHGRKESASKRSREYLLTCPFPDCGSSRLRWNAGKATWICWGCRRTGDTLLLVQIFERTDDEGAIAYVLGKYVGGDAPTELTDLARTPGVRAHEVARRLPPIPWPPGVDLVVPGAEQHARALDYLHGRGILDAVITSYRLGFGRHGRLKDYILFPCWMDGALVYWQGRATWDPPSSLSHEERKVWVETHHFRKTLNPTNRDDGSATAENILFNFDGALGQPHIVICEGPVDAIKVGRHAVALLGKEPGPDKVWRLLRMRGVTRYTVYLDRGEEERARAERLAAELSAYAPTFIATPPEGHDPGSLSPEQNAAIILSAERYCVASLRSTLRA